MAVSIARCQSYDEAEVASSLLRALTQLGLPEDNPLGDLIRPGDHVFIKPNWVAHRYRASCPRQDDLYSTITHPSVIRAVVRRVDEALQGSGGITIGDNPSIDADFDALRARMDLEDLREGCAVPVEILDLRPLRCADLAHYGRRELMTAQPGDPRGVTTVDLGRSSLLWGTNPRLLRGIFDDRRETIAAHHGETHRYEFSTSIFRSDVYVSLPKLKTHHKVGTTLNLKGLVGTVSNKNLLVHWREGFPGVGGDAYPSFWTWLKGIRQKVKKRGAWQGNDTIWRMVVDLYEAFQQGPPKCFSIIDGIVGGEGNGPFCPRAKSSKVLIASGNLLEADLAATRLMGFDVRAVPYLRYLMDRKRIDLEALEIRSDDLSLADFWNLDTPHLDFEPPEHWPALRRYETAS